MNIFSSKTEMNRVIKQQSAEIERLRTEKSSCLQEVDKLKTEIAKITKENMIYDEKYVHTNVECDFCYTTLQNEFVFCPKCGKKVKKAKAVDNVDNGKNNESLFGVEVDGDYMLIIQYNGFDDKKVVIPSEINGRKVIGVWDSVFEKCLEIEEVFFEEGCQYIGKNAFDQCSNLKRIKLPKSLLEIGDSAFSGCAFEEIAVPPNVKSIGSYAFSHSNLKKLLLPDQLKYISNGMLSGTSIENISIPQSVIHIGAYAFFNTKLKEVELPDNLYSINNSAFDTPTLKKITIHSNIKIMVKDIFNAATKPTIYCSAGSKGHLYARKYGLECREIPPKPAIRVQTCASSIILVFGSVTKGDIITPIYRRCGINKAATWSWKAVRCNEVDVKKFMDMDEALRIKRDLLNFVNSHSDPYKPGFHCTLQELSICEHWGESEV